MLQILEVDSDRGVVCSHCEYNASMFFRMKGLLGRKGLSGEEGILLKPCNSIHMFFMKFAIDAVFLNKDYKVLKIYHSIKPWHLTPIIFGAAATLEMAAGVCEEKGLQVGDQLVFREVG